MYSRGGITPPPDRILELESGSRRQTADTQPDVAELAAPAGLTHELAFLLDLARSSPCSDLRLATLASTLNSRSNPVDDDLEVELSMPNERLPVRGRTFRRNEGSSAASLSGSRRAAPDPLGLRLDCHRDHRLGKLIGLEQPG